MYRIPTTRLMEKDQKDGLIIPNVLPKYAPIATGLATTRGKKSHVSGHAHDNAFFFYCFLIRIGCIYRPLITMKGTSIQ